MADFVRVASRKEIPSGQGRMFEVNGRQVAVFNAGGELHAIDNVCEHQGGPLAEGELDGCVVTCPWHGWTYDVTTGASPDDPDTRVQRFALRVEGDDVLVAVPAQA
jgi:nitrite reductase/ring-hydroxylating ferredoxin subunit